MSVKPSFFICTYLESLKIAVRYTGKVKIAVRYTVKVKIAVRYTVKVRDTFQKRADEKGRLHIHSVSIKDLLICIFY